MRFIYNVFTYLVWFFLNGVALFNKKVKQFVNGRKTSTSFSFKKSPLWVHCASIGEFEQARPIIEQIKEEHSDHEIILTFFSPSGINHLKKFDQVDAITYAPFDCPSHIKKWIKEVNPSALLLIKYEFWKNLIHITNASQVPVYSVSSIFRENQRFFNSLKPLFLLDLKKINHFFVQDQNSSDLLNSIGISDVSVTGDTRFDRVIEIAENSQEIDSIKTFVHDRKVLVAGSTWPEDETFIYNCLETNSEWSVIIAPHEVHKKRIEEIKNKFNKYKIVTFTGSNGLEISKCQILVIDSIGLLNRIYKYADICMVGGGFKTGLHNILEAAVWSKPILHGPVFQKFNEANDLVRLKGSLVIHQNLSVSEEIQHLLNSESERDKCGKISKDYVYQNMGATLKVISHLKQKGIF